MKTFCIFFFLFAHSGGLYAQKIKKPDIQYVTLTDTVLVNEVKKLIAYGMATDTLFAMGYGGVLVTPSYYYRYGDLKDPYRTDTVLTYYLTLFFPPPKGLVDSDEGFTICYSVIDNRLVYFSDSHGIVERYFDFSERSKKRVRKVQQKYGKPYAYPVPQTGGKTYGLYGPDWERRIFFMRRIDSQAPYDFYSVVTAKKWEDCCDKR